MLIRNTKYIKKINSLSVSKKLKEIFSGTDISMYLYASVDSYNWKKIYLRAIQLEATDKKIFFDFLISISKINKILLEEEIYSNLIMNIFTRRNLILRDYSKLKLKKSNILNNLINHLFKQYEVPKFLYKYFNSPNYESLNTPELKFFFWITSGKSIKKYPNHNKIHRLNSSLKYLFECDSALTIKEAYLMSQLKLLKAPEKMVSNIMQCDQLVNFSKSKEMFKYQLLEYFVNLPMFDYNNIPLIVDYIYSIKYELKTTIVKGLPYRYAEQPNFSLKNRSVYSLQRSVNNWHSKLQSIKNSKYSSWEPLNVKEYEFINKKIIIQIKEITNTKDLIHEGKILNHCVYSYEKSCINKRCHIFSYTTDDTINKLKTLTIEVKPKFQQTTIVQIRGKSNRLPNQNEIHHIKNWAKDNNIKISKWLHI